jgi:hypothetical protein
MIVLVFKYLIPKGFRGFTFFPFVFLSDKKDKSHAVLMNHERIHYKQQIELGILFFFLWYIVEFCINWFKLRDKQQAYHAISFEQEAYENETDLAYLKNRKGYAFVKYLKS